MGRSARVAGLLLFALVAGAPVAGPTVFGSDGGAWAAEDWRREFDGICSRTDDAMNLSREELTKLVERCDNLKPLMGSLDETRQKVYLKRLQMCRDLFAYILATTAQMPP